MDIGLLHVRLLLDTEADLQVAALVISAVANRLLIPETFEARAAEPCID